MYEKVLEGIRRTFGPIDDLELSPSTRLVDLPEWDSMTAVSLLIQIGKLSGKTVQKLRLTPEMTLEQLAGNLSEL